MVGLRTENKIGAEGRVPRMPRLQQTQLQQFLEKELQEDISDSGRRDGEGGGAGTPATASIFLVKVFFMPL